MAELYGYQKNGAHTQSCSTHRIEYEVTKISGSSAVAFDSPTFYPHTQVILKHTLEFVNHLTNQMKLKNFHPAHISCQTAVQPFVFLSECAKRIFTYGILKSTSCSWPCTLKRSRVWQISSRPSPELTYRTCALFHRKPSVTIYKHARANCKIFPSSTSNIIQPGQKKSMDYYAFSAFVQSP